MSKAKDTQGGNRVKEPEIIWFAEMPKAERLETSEVLGPQELTWERIFDEELEVSRVMEELEEADKPYGTWHAFAECLVSEVGGGGAT